MSQLEARIDPTSTNQLLNNFNLAIDEIKLVLRINKLNDQVYQIELSEGRTDRLVFLRKEVNVLEVQLNYIRDRAS